jgi:hypothetical protein
VVGFGQGQKTLHGFAAEVVGASECAHFPLFGAGKVARLPPLEEFEQPLVVVRVGFG